MKKLLTVLLAASLGSMAFADGHDFPDVPSGHWAEDAVERIADLNIVIGFPDGTFRGNEAFTRYQASLVMSRLLNIVNADMATMGARLSAVESAVSDASDIAAIENDVAAVGVAADAAQSTADANAAEIAALNQIMQLLGDQVEELQSDTGAADAVAALEGDVANIREFVILLRRDQVAVRDRVSDLEGSVATLEPAVSDLEGRVSALEANPLGFNGSISLSYIETAVGGDETQFFDIDRAYGVGLTESMGASAFSTGAKDGAADADDDVDAAGEYAQDRADIGTNADDTGATTYGSDFSSTISISLGGDLAFAGESTPRGLNSFSAVANFELNEITADTDGGQGEVSFYAFQFDSFSSTFEAIGAGPITVDFGEEVAVDFTPYTLSAEQVGLSASIGAPDMLAFLDPALHIAYLTSDLGGAALEGSTLAIRGTMSPIAGLTGGVSYINEVAANLDDLDTANETKTTIGADGAGTFSVAGIDLTLSGEYATFADSANADAAMDILFVDASATVADILGGVTISGNYRDIDTDWDLGDADAYAYDVDQVGFGASVTVGLLIADLTAFYDSYTVPGNTTANTGFGVSVTTESFAGFTLTGSYDQAMEGTTVVDGNNSADTGYSVSVSHNADADDALIAGLGLSASYAAESEGFDVTTISASADYSATISILTLTPYVSYEIVTDGDTAANSGTTLTGGLGVVTEALDVMFAPSLEAAVNYVSETQTQANVTGTQLQWSVGLNLGEFLLPNTTLSARYGSYGSTKWTVDDMSAGVSDAANAAAVSGFEVELNFYDLVLDYGRYVFDSNTAADDTETTATAFGVAYNVGF